MVQQVACVRSEIKSKVCIIVDHAQAGSHRVKPVQFYWSKQVKGDIENLTKERALLYTCMIYKARQEEQSQGYHTIACTNFLHLGPCNPQKF